jgi:Transglycosylase SLT domain
LRLRQIAALGLLLLAFAHGARADYIVLRNGQRLDVTGYQLVGDKYKLQMVGGSVEIPASEVAGIEPQDVFTPVVRLKTASQAPFRELVEKSALRYGVDADLISSVMGAESNFNPRAISRKNARGLMQLLPETAARLGVRNIFDPQENIDAGTRYLQTLLVRYHNDLALTLAAYNAGPQRVGLYGRVPPFPETISYVRRVRSAYTKRKSSAPGKPDDRPALPAAGEPPSPATQKTGQF